MALLTVHQTRLPQTAHQEDRSGLACPRMDRLAAFQDSETAISEEPNPGLHGTEIPGGRVGKLRPESIPRAGPPAVTIGPVAARHNGVKGLDEHMALGPHIARLDVKQVFHRVFSQL